MDLFRNGLCCVVSMFAEEVLHKERYPNFTVETTGGLYLVVMTEMTDDFSAKKVIKLKGLFDVDLYEKGLAGR